MRLTPFLFAVFCLLLLAGCDFFREINQKDQADLIARVGDEKLYASELLQVTAGLKGEDSVQALKGYADQWVKRKVLLNKAMDHIRESDLNIDGLVKSYRESLILFEYEKELVYEKLDTALAQQEIEQYYETHKDGFILPKDMYQVFYIKLPSDAPDLKEARKWILKPSDEEDIIMAEGYSKQFSSGFELKNALWMDAGQLQERFKLNLSAVAPGGFKEYRVEEGLLFVKVAAVYKSGTTAPLAFVSDEIRKIMLEKRKGEMIDGVYKKVYQDAVRKGSAEIFVR